MTGSSLFRNSSASTLNGKSSQNLLRQQTLPRSLSISSLSNKLTSSNMLLSNRLAGNNLLASLNAKGIKLSPQLQVSQQSSKLPDHCTKCMKIYDSVAEKRLHRCENGIKLTPTTRILPSVGLSQSNLRCPKCRSEFKNKDGLSLHLKACLTGKSITPTTQISKGNKLSLDPDVVDLTSETESKPQKSNDKGSAVVVQNGGKPQGGNKPMTEGFSVKRTIFTDGSTWYSCPNCVLAFQDINAIYNHMTTHTKNSETTPVKKESTVNSKDTKRSKNVASKHAANAEVIVNDIDDESNSSVNEIDTSKLIQADDSIESLKRKLNIEDSTKSTVDPDPPKKRKEDNAERTKLKSFLDECQDLVSECESLFAPQGAGTGKKTGADIDSLYKNPSEEKRSSYNSSSNELKTATQAAVARAIQTVTAASKVLSPVGTLSQITNKKNAEAKIEKIENHTPSNKENFIVSKGSLIKKEPEGPPKGPKRIPPQSGIGEIIKDDGLVVKRNMLVNGKLKKVTMHRCQFCGKEYKTKAYVKLHEDKTCKVLKQKNKEEIENIQNIKQNIKLVAEEVDKKEIQISDVKTETGDDVVEVVDETEPVAREGEQVAENMTNDAEDVDVDVEETDQVVTGLEEVAEEMEHVDQGIQEVAEQAIQDSHDSLDEVANMDDNIEDSGVDDNDIDTNLPESTVLLEKLDASNKFTERLHIPALIWIREDEEPELWTLLGKAQDFEGF